MYKRYYDGYGSFENQRVTNNTGELVIPRACAEDNDEKNNSACCDNEISAECCPSPPAKGGLSSRTGFDKMLCNIALDDIILFGVILLVLKDSVDDPLLIIILTVVFISGFVEG